MRRSTSVSFESVKTALCTGIAMVLCAAALPASASAQKRVVVSPIEGRGGSMLRAGAVRALKDEVQIVGSSDVSDAASRLGVADGPGAQISAELEIAAWVVGEVERSRRRVAITFSVIDGNDGQSLGVVSYEAKNPKQLQRRVQRKLWDDVADLIANAQAPSAAAAEPEEVFEEPEPEPEPMYDDADEEAEDEPAREPEDDGMQDGPSPLDVGLSLAGFSRSFDYNDDLSGLRTYDLGLGPTIMLDLRWYPAAHFDDSIMANLGIELRGQFAFGIDSALGEVSFPTSARGLGAGLRFRVPIDDHELAAFAGYATQSFEIEAAREGGVAVDPGIPSASYAYARLGAELRFAIGDAFAIGIGGAFLPTFSSGEIEEWFPQASATGMEGELSLAYALSPSFELNAAAGLQRFAFSFDPEHEDVTAGRAIAGGAVDQYVWGTLGARWLLGR